eukprot:1186726-Pyramimonas_sp.AAC.1
MLSAVLLFWSVASCVSKLWGVLIDTLYSMVSDYDSGGEERRLRPLYEAIDSRNYKAALKIADTLLKVCYACTANGVRECEHKPICVSPELRDYFLNFRSMDDSTPIRKPTTGETEHTASNLFCNIRYLGNEVHDNAQTRSKELLGSLKSCLSHINNRQSFAWFG